MPGELNTRPDLVEQVDALKQRIYELERRLAGDEQHLALGDLTDVRVDGLADATITRPDGSALTFRASDGMWVPNTISASFPLVLDDGTYTYSIVVGSGLMTIKVVKDSDATHVVDMILDALNGDLDVLAKQRDFNITQGRDINLGSSGARDVNIQSGATHDLNLFGAGILQLNGGQVGFFAAGSSAQLTVTGSRGGNAALASLLTALQTYGLIVDSSSP